MHDIIAHIIQVIVVCIQRQSLGDAITKIDGGLQAAALVNTGGVDLHARALTRDDPCGRTLHAREKLGALVRVRKVKVELLDRIRCSEKLRSISSAAVPLALKLST